MEQLALLKNLRLQNSSLQKTSLAYDALARGDSIADKYTEIKYSYLMAKNTVSISIQGLDYAPSDLASLQPGKDNSDSRQLQEAVKRCLVEISLKECLLGLKTITPSHPLPAELKTLEVALIATRQIRRNGKPPKQLISVVDAYITSEGISVTKVRRSPWAEDNVAAIDFLLDFPFLQPVGKKLISDKQFWIVDKHTQKRLTVWAGAFVPRIILNNNYSSVEDALGAQEPYLANLRKSGKKGKYYSKGKDFNLLPYYMSMYLSEHQRTRELTGTRIPLQDCGEFLRVFIPPAGGINGPGDSLSGMRDVMLYEEGGKSVNSRLLEQPLVLLYLHTMTNGILVGGDNSKMSILEKLAKLALEN
ncbi:hypothetical protein [Deefgea sp. CFH1-16]|uniref:hypothetical protein n=1 Tax=Deefgea sp. CFH1-16 TaxID=2675457 RepID=UPI00194020D6|nr:hypothetical protein [Deefgea sp. CFH1-16]